MSDIISISNLGIRWDSAPSYFAAFAADSGTACVMEFSGASVPEAYGITYMPSPSSHCLVSGAGGILTANEDWSKITAYCGSAKDPEYALVLAAVCSRFAAFSTLLLHGSFVDFEGNGIVFAGPSGIGKTTQAELWNRFTGADIVNGDKLMLRCMEEKVYACSLPWKGSSPYCLNRNVPLRGIVALRQAKENRIRRLNALECAEYFIPHVFLPHWDLTAVDQTLGTLDCILKQIPVWLLECRPDKEAVDLVKDTLFDN